MEIAYTILFPRKGIFKKIVRFENLIKCIPLGDNIIFVVEGIWYKRNNLVITENRK